MWISTLEVRSMAEGNAGGYSFGYKFAETAEKCFSFCSLVKTRNWLGINWLIWFEGLLFDGFGVVSSPFRFTYEVWSSQECENFTLIFCVKMSWSFGGFCNLFRNCLHIRSIIQRRLWIRISVLFRLITKHWMLPWGIMYLLEPQWMWDAPQNSECSY